MFHEKTAFGATVAVFAVSLALRIPRSSSAEIFSSWNALDNGRYDVAANWDPPIVPLNNGDTFDVSISENVTVLFEDLNGSIDGLFLDSGAQLNVDDTNDLDAVDTGLVVSGAAQFAGNIEARNGASLTAIADGTEFVGNRFRLAAIDGGTVQISASTYSSRGWSFGQTILESVGMESTLDLAEIQSIDAGFNDNNANATSVQEITATVGGQIDLSGVREIMKPARVDDRLDLNIADDSRIDLTSLESITGAGRMRITVDEGTLALGPVATATRTTLDVSGGGNVTTSGQGITGDGFTTTSFRGGLILRSTGSGSLLGLSSFASLNAGFDDNNPNATRVQQIDAKLGGAIDLSGVMSLTAPARSEDRLDVNVDGGTVDLSSLSFIAGPVGIGGQTVFNVDDGTLTLGPLEEMRRTFFRLGTSSTVTAGGFQGTASVVDSTFSVQGGSRFQGGELAGTYSSSGLSLGGQIFVSSGMEAVLNLSALESIDAGFNDNNANATHNQEINAIAGGQIDLSGVQTITKPASSDDRLDLNVADDSRIDLTSLESITGAGQMRVTVDQGTLALGPLATATRTTFDVSGGGVVTSLGKGVEGNCYDSTDAVVGGVMLQSRGNGSLLDLSSFSCLNAAFDDNNANATRVQQINATVGAQIDLSGVRAITKPARSEDRIDVNVEDGGSVDLTSLGEIDGNGRMSVVVNTGTLELGPLATATRTSFDVSGGGRISTDGLSVPGEGYNSARFLGGRILRATGNGSLLDLSSFSTLNAGFDDNNPNSVRIQRVDALVNGIIDLSGVTSLTAPARVEDRIDFTVESDGHLNMASLNGVTGAGQTRFLVRDGELTMGPLAEVEQVTIDLDSQAIVEAPSDLVLGAGVTINMEVGQSSNARVNVAEVSTFGGHLQIEWIGNDLTLGEEFEIVHYHDRTKDSLFRTVGGALLGNDLALGQKYTDNSLLLIAAYPGDTNLDGRVDARDLNDLAQRWNQSETAWEHGDFTGDGQTNVSDLNLLALNWQKASEAQLATTLVPEPHGLLVLSFMAVVSTQLFRRRRRSLAHAQ